MLIRWEGKALLLFSFQVVENQVVSVNFGVMGHKTPADLFLNFGREFVAPFVSGPKMTPSASIVFDFQRIVLLHVFQYVDTLEEGKSAVFSLFRDVVAVLSVVAQWLAHLHYATLPCEEDIEEPVAAEAHVLIAVGFIGMVTVATEETFANVGDGISGCQFLTYEILAGVEIHLVAVGGVPEFIPVLVNPPGGSVN